MTDDRSHDGTGGDSLGEPVLARRPAPEHRPGFWVDLEAAMAASPPARRASADGLDGAAAEAPGTGGPFSRRRPAPSLRSQRQPAPATPGTIELPGPAERPAAARRAWVAAVAVAATALVIVGLGVVLVRGGDDASGPEIATDAVVRTPDAVTAPLDGSAGDGAGDTGSTSADSPSTGGDTASEPASGDASPRDVAASGFTLAPGAVADRVYLPTDGGIPADATILATWPARQLTWYGVADPTRSCDEMAYSEIRYVFESGVTLAVHDPQLHFSGDISHFVLDASERHVAWLVSCGNQLELYVAHLLGNGSVEGPTLVWFGFGAPDEAHLVWDGSVVRLNAVGLDGEAYDVDFDVNGRRVSGTGVLVPAGSEPGAPANVRPVPLDASADGLFSYWAAPAVDSALSASDRCPSEVLWLRQPGPQWVPATEADLGLRSIDVVAIGFDATRIAFADSCEGTGGRVFIGVPGGDGLIREVRELDLSPYVPGFADRLFWVDESTLRIETDNSANSVDRYLFEYELGTGDQPGSLLELGRAN